MDIFELNIDDIDDIDRNREVFIKKYYNTIYEKYFHIFFIIIFEVLFYFNYIVKIENIDIIEILNSFGVYINNIGVLWKDIIPEPEEKMINNICAGINNNLVSKSNEDLEKQCIFIIWMLSIIWIILSIIHYTLYKSLKMLINNLIKSILFIFFIGIFELYFFTMIISNYIFIKLHN